MNGSADFSRQLKVAGMSAQAQARLRAARVLVFGAGGLGATAVPWLAAAGVGQISIVDGDTVAASNLHRQLPFTYADIGNSKAQGLAAFCRARMADGATCTAIDRELQGEALLAAVQAHDVVLDCSDSRTLAYALNDAALIAGKPVVFANAAALGGQLFTLQPGEDKPCWRCAWPEEVLPGGNCDALGVMGPVPGVFGLFQALEALKLLTGFAPPLCGQVLQYDFVAMRQLLLRVERRPGCHHAPDAAALTPAPLFQGTLADAVAEGLRLVDIRTEEECCARPLPVRAEAVPMARLLQAPQAVLQTEECAVLVCASGKRAQAAAAALRRLGYRAVMAYPTAW